MACLCCDMQWLLSLPRIQSILPLEMRKTITILTTYTNDGTNERGNKKHRPLHASIIRCSTLGREALSLNNCVLNSLHETPESTTHFLKVFKDDTIARDNFNRHCASSYGFKKHFPFLCADGGATPHHVGTSGTGATFGCCWCTRHKDLKCIIKADVKEDDHHTLALIGTNRTFAETVRVMAKFEVDLAKEMEDNIEWYGQFASLPVVRNDMLFCFPV